MFKIINYLPKLEIVKETSTHIIAVCPVCGDDNFKIVKKGRYQNAYKCWSNHCDGQEIRKALGIKPPKHPQVNKPKPIRITPAKVPFTGTRLVTVNDYSPIVPKLKRFSGGSKTEERVYPYSRTQRVLRIDNLNKNSKNVFIQFQRDDFVWVCGAGNNFWPTYSRGIQNSLKDTSFDTVLFVEGEKTAEFCKERGLAAITLMAGNFDEGLDKSLLLFGAKYPHIHNVIYVPDADSPGLLKADKIEKSCWRNHMGCKILPMNNFVNDPFEGMDLADLDETTFIEFSNVVTRTSNFR